MTAGNSSSEIVRIDEGAINARILARESKVDFRRVEAASVKVVTRLTSAEGKRLFVRFFSTLQLNAHFISVLARTRLDTNDVAKVESTIKTRMDAVATQLDQAIDGAEALFKANGLTSAATYDTQPMEIEVGIISSTGRRYLEVIGKLDQLMPLLQTLEIYEVISTQALDLQRASVKRQVRDIANSARSLASGLRRRMNSMTSGPGKLPVDAPDNVLSEPSREMPDALNHEGLAGGASWLPNGTARDVGREIPAMDGVLPPTSELRGPAS